MPTLRLAFTRAAFVAALLVLTGPAGRTQAQGPSQPKDDDLDRFLQNIDAPKSETEKEKEKTPPQPKGGLSAKDKDLDGFLEKLGETKETPAPDDHPKGPAQP